MTASSGVSENRSGGSGKLPRPVVFLGITSFLNDVASEMVYPLLPVFLTVVLGASAETLGLIEGVAESVASVTRYFSGKWSDRTERKTRFVLAGYIISMVSRPWMAAITAPIQAVWVRFADRVGKGIRSAPRDAWLSRLARKGDRGRVFGFHRAMDNAGAVFGPLLATAFLWVHPDGYRELFLFTLAPAALGLFFIVLADRAEQSGAKSPSAPRAEERKASAAAVSVRALAGALPLKFKVYALWVFLFTLANSSDAFLLVKLARSGVPEPMIPLAWAGLHVIKSGGATWGGALSDRWGRRRMILLGWILFSVVYGVIALRPEMDWVLGAFFAYGIFSILTEGAERALVADLVPQKQVGHAFGVFHWVLAIGALPASVGFGYLMDRFGDEVAFGVSSLVAAAAAAGLAVSVRVGRRRKGAVA